MTLLFVVVFKYILGKFLTSIDRHDINGDGSSFNYVMFKSHNNKYSRFFDYWYKIHTFLVTTSFGYNFIGLLPIFWFVDTIVMLNRHGKYELNNLLNS